MARLRRLLIVAVGALLLALPQAADAQSKPSDANTVPGNNAAAGTNGCPSTSNCFVPYSSAFPLPVGSGAITITQTVVTLTAATSRTLIAANTSRKYLFWMNIGNAPFTAAPGAVTVTAGQGANYDPGSSSINQGGAFSMENSSVSQQAFSAISTAGTTVVVWEGQ